MTARHRRAPAPAQPPSFEQEIRSALRYERGLVVKALLALALVAGILLAHVYLFS